MVLYKRITIILALFFVFLNIVDAAVPKVISYRSRLRDTNGNPIIASTTIQFSLYNDKNLGSPSDTVSQNGPLLWKEVYDGNNLNCPLIVPNSLGYLNVNLGSCVEFPDYLDFNTEEIYIGVKINGDSEALPRVRFTSAPYALNSQKVNGFSATSTATQNQLLALDNDLNFNIASGTFIGSALRLSSITGSTQCLQIDTNGNVSGTGTACNQFSLNGLSSPSQTFSISATGTDFSITSTGTVHTFNLPDASSFARGLLTSSDWTLFNNKENLLTFGEGLLRTGDTITNNGVLGATGTIGRILNIGTVKNPIFDLAPSGVNPGVYGSSFSIPTFTVDSFGRITDVSTTSVHIENQINSSQNILSSIVNGSISSTTIITQNVASSSGNLFEILVNGISSGVKSFINSFSQNVNGNILSTNINGVIATTSIIKENGLNVSGTTLTSTINGISTSTNLQSIIDNGSTNLLTISTTTNSFTLVSNVNGKTSTTTAASFINSNGINSLNNTLTSIVNGVSSSTSIINNHSLTASSGIITSNTNGIIATTSISNLFTFLASSTNSNLTVATDNQGKVTYIFTDNPIFNNATITKATISTLNADNASITNATTSNFFSNILNTITGYFTNLFATNISASTTNTDNLNAINATITNLNTNNTLTNVNNVLTSNIGGSISSTTIITQNVASSSGNLFEILVNGISSGVKSFINSFSQNVNGNILSTNINGVIATTSIIKENGLNVSGTTLTSTINGISTSTNLQSIIDNGSTNLLTISTTTNSFTLISTVNGKTSTTTAASFINSNGINSLNNTLTSIVNGVSSSTSIINNHSLTASSGIITSNTNGIIATTSISNLFTFLASSTNSNLTVATDNQGKVTYIFTDNPIFNNATITKATISTLNADNASITNATTSNFFSNILRSITGYFTDIFTTNISASTTNTDNLNAINATITNLNTNNTLTNVNNVLTSNIGGSISSTTIITQNVASSSGNLFEILVNGISSGVKSFINSFSQNVNGNILSTNINGVIATTSIIKENGLNVSGTILTSTINGISTSTNLQSIIDNGITNLLTISTTTNSFTLVSNVNGKTSTTTSASFINSNGINSLNNTLTSIVNGVSSSTSIITNHSLTASSGIITSNTNGIIATTSISNLFTFLASSTNSNLTVATDNQGKVTYIFTDNPIFNNATITKATISTLNADNASITNATTSNFFSNILRSITGYFTDIFTTNISASTTNTDNLNAINATITNLNTNNTLTNVNNVLTSNIGGSISSTTIITQNVASSSGNLFEILVNGISSGVKSFINSFSQNVNGNILSTNINGVIATTSIIKENGLNVSGTTLTSTINGISTSTNLQSIIDNGSTNLLTISTTTNSFTLISTVNGKTSTTTAASFINSNGINSLNNTLTSIVNGVSSSTSIITNHSLTASSGIITSNTNGVIATTSISNLFTFLASSTNSNLTVATDNQGKVTYIFTDNPIFNNATITKATISTLNANNASITNATTSNFFTNVLNTITGYFTNLFATNISASTTNTDNLNANNATITNLNTNNTLTNVNNVLTSNIGGSISSTTIITQNVLSYSSTNTLVSTINGAATSIDIINQNLLSSNNGILTSYVNGVLATTTLSVNWGNISGLLSNQADLQSALDNKLSTSSLSIGTGQVAFGTDTNIIGGDDEFVWDNDNKMLGIGTSPAYELDVKGSINLTDKIYYKSNAFLDGDPDLETFLIANKNLPFSSLSNTDTSLVIGGSGSSLSDLYSTIIIGSNSAPTLTASTDNIIIGVDSYPNGNSTGNILIGNRIGDVLQTGADNILIGNDVTLDADESRKLNIGNIIKGDMATGDVSILNKLTVGAYTLPATDGTANQVLKTDGSGTLTWQNDNGIALTSLSATAPLSYNNTTGDFSISQANTSTNGYLSSTDWNTFNDKQAALGFTPENVANKKTTLTDNSDTYYPTQKAVKTAVDAKLNSSALSISTGQVAFGSGTNTIGGDNGLSWDNTNKRLGIGTITPQSSLYINQLQTGTNDLTVGNLTLSSKNYTLLIEASQNKAGNSGVRPSIAMFNSLNTNSGLAFSLFRVFTGKNDSYSNTRGAIFGAFADNGGDTFSYMYFGVNNKQDYNNNILKIGESGLAINHSGYNAPSQAFYVNGTSEFQGNVGIGTASPSQKLHVVGNGIFTGTLKVGAYTLPSTDGSANQVLKTNGSGVLTWQNDSGIALTSLSATTPLAYNNTTGDFSISQANTSTNGYLSSTDWNTFNNKQTALVSGSNIKTINSQSLLGSGDINIKESQWTSTSTSIYYNSGNVGIGTTTPSTALVVVGTSTFHGAVVPTSNGGFSLGTPTLQWGDLYVGSSSIYVNGKKILQDISDTITFTTDINQNLVMKTSGTGNLNLNSSSTGSLNINTVDGNLNLESFSSGNVNIKSANGNINIGLTGGNVKLGVIATGTWNGSKIDISNYTNLSVATNSKLKLISSMLDIDSNYNIPLSASTTEWSNFYNTPSTRIIAGNNLSWSGNTLNVSTISTSSIRDLFSATAPLAYNNTTGVFSLPKADTSTNGYLSSTDWNTFNNKISTSHTINNIVNGTGFLKNNGSGTWSYDNTTYASASSLNNYLPLTGGTLTGALTGTNISISGKYTASNGTLDTPNTLGLFGYGGGETNRSVVIQNILNSSTANQYLFLNGSLGSSSTISTTTLTSAYASSFGFESNDNSLNVITAAAGTNLSAIKAMTFKNNGNIGINNTSPSEKLDVVGNGKFSGTLKVGAYTLPSTDGSSNQVLKTNGSGTLSWQNDSGIALTSLSATAPLLYNNSTGVFSISQANGSTNGYLSSADWNTFNNKLNASAVSIATGQVAFGSGTNTIGGDDGLYWDNTNKRLGIGNTTPQEKLDISGNFRVTNTTFANKNGIIYKGSTPFISDFNYGNNGSVTTEGLNTMIGVNAGNLTMGSTATMSFQSSLNTFIGNSAGYANTTGYSSSFIGASAGYSNTTGGRNTFIGKFAGYPNTTGSSNTFIGNDAGRFLANGSTPKTTGDNSVFIGADTKASADGISNEIAIGQGAIGLGTNSVVIGNSSISKTILQGNVGIGTATPGVSLDIAKDFAANDGLRLLDASGGYFQVIQSTATAGAFQPVFQGLAKGNGMSSLIFKALQTTGTAPTNGTVRFIARDSTDTAAINATDIAFRFDNNNTAALSILGNGNVGIGTTTPSQKLHVVGNGLFTGTVKVGAYTLPSTDGSANQVLKTNGSGSLTWQNDSGGISLTDLSATSPLSYNNGTGVFSISQANGSTNGYLSSADWNTFNDKQAALGFTPENVANKKTTLTDNSDTYYPTQKAVKTAVDAKQDTITGGATTITSSNLTANRVLLSDGSGKVAVSSVTNTELGYVGGVTSNIQTQLDNKISTSSVSGSANQVAYFNGSNSITSSSAFTHNNGTIVLTKSNDNQNYLALTNNGTNNHIYGFMINATGISGLAGKNLYITSDSGASDILLKASTNAGNGMILKANGNVGIGTTTPSEVLDVVGNGKFSGTLKVGAYTLPSTDGSSNQVLKTNGSGTLSWQNDSGIALTSLSATAPLSYNNTTGVFSISQANTSTNGYLSSTDWNTFNDKQAALGFTPENVANKKTTLTDNSDTYYPTQKAVKTAVDAKLNSSALSISTGQVAFGSGSNTIGGDNGLFWDNSNKRLGIGNTSPLLPLDVTGGFGVKPSGSGFPTSLNGNYPGQFYAVHNAGNYGFVITRAVNDTAAANLTFYHTRNSNASTKSALVNGDSIGLISFQGPTDSSTVNFGAGIRARVNGTVSSGKLPAEIVFETTDTSGTSAERFIIKNEGSVGIGTTTPSEKLHVVGNGLFTGTVKVGNYKFPSVDGSANQVLKTDGQGRLTWQNDIGSSIYAHAPLLYSTTTEEFSISVANGSTNGYLSSTDWNTFNNKQTALGFTPENVSNKKTTLSDNSDTYYPTQKAVKTAVDAKQDTITGGATTITSSNLTANRVLLSDGSGKVAVSSVTNTELGYVGGVTSNIQTQLDNKLPSSSLSLLSGQVAFGSGTNTIGGSSNLTYTNSQLSLTQSNSQQNYGLLMSNSYNNLGIRLGNGLYANFFGYQQNNDTSSGASYGASFGINAFYDGTNWYTKNGYIVPSNILTKGNGSISFFANDINQAGTPGNFTQNERMTILGNGNIGINATSPTQKLDINGNLRLRGGLYDSFNLIGNNGQILSATGTSTKWINKFSENYNDLTDRPLFYYDGESSFISRNAGTDGDGSNPSNLENVLFIGYNAGYGTATTSDSIFLGKDSGNGAGSASSSIFIGPRAGIDASYARNSIFIGKSAGANDIVENGSRDSSILIGLETSTDGNRNSIALGMYATNENENELMIGNNNDDKNAIDIVQIKMSSSQSCIIDNTGINCSSDYTLKRNIVNINNNTEFNLEENINIEDNSILEKLLKVSPVEFNWNSESDNDRKHSGFIAQEVQKIFPLIVSTTSNGKLTMNYGALIPYIVSAFQEQNKILIGSSTLTYLTKNNATNTIEDIKNNNNNINIFENIQNRINQGINIIVDFVVAKITAIKGYFEELFAKKIHVEVLCIKRSNGTEFCANGDDIERAVNNSYNNNNQNNNNNNSNNTNQETPVEENTENIETPNEEIPVEENTENTENTNQETPVEENTENIETPNEEIPVQENTENNG